MTAPSLLLKNCIYKQMHMITHEIVFFLGRGNMCRNPTCLQKRQITQIAGSVFNNIRNSYSHVHKYHILENTKKTKSKFFQGFSHTPTLARILTGILQKSGVQGTLRQGYLHLIRQGRKRGQENPTSHGWWSREIWEDQSGTSSTDDRGLTNSENTTKDEYASSLQPHNASLHIHTEKGK